ncbi:efflux RND transporter permease subunit [Wukongibacter baidiensis]|uniref:efflux RND transporter permease subunit n=1 Tax=Wukongibacter baidiensis TaxID=1723361 RepID=UPI003D7FF68D
MNFTKICIKRPITTIMMTLIVVLLGLVSTFKLPLALFPKVEIPFLLVMTTYEGVGPEEVEELVTKPLEETISSMNNLKKISSTSSEGQSTIEIEFNYGTDINFAALELREKIDLVKAALPKGSKSPLVYKFDLSDQPIVEISLSSDEDLDAVKIFAKDKLKPRLERIKGAASVSVTGGRDREVEITLNRKKAEGYGLTIDYIAQIIQANNQNIPGGKIQKGNRKLNIRTNGELKSIEEMEKIPIPLTGGGMAYLSDIAKVELSHKDVSSIVKLNGNEAIKISIKKQSGSNVVNVGRLINSELEKIKKEYPNIKFVKVLDQSTLIQSTISNVIKSAALGAVFAVMVLYVFLRNIRTTMIIGIAIPVSIIATLSLIYFKGISLNMMTLGGLALGIGMLVDNSIVVLENIFRYMQNGYSRKEAAIEGTKEIGLSVIASTLTTVAVFLPLAFLKGMIMQLFHSLALTVTFSLLSSLAVSLTLVPMLCSKFLKIEQVKQKGNYSRSKILSKIYEKFDYLFDKLEKNYRSLLKWSLGHRKTTILMGILIFLVSIASLTTVGYEFFPKTDDGTFNVNVTLPVGSTIEDTGEVVSRIESKIGKMDEIKTIQSTMGGGEFEEGGEGNKATISVTSKKLGERKRSVNEIANDVREEVKNIAGAEITVKVTSTTSFSGGGKPLDFKIRGKDLEVLKKINNDFVEIIGSVEGTKDVRGDLSEGVPQVRLDIDRDRASRYGLSLSTIANGVRNNIDGTIATTYKINGKKVDVVIKGDETYKQSIANLKQVMIPVNNGTRIPLSNVAKINMQKGPVSLKREDQMNQISITGEIYGRDVGSIVKDANAKLAEYDMPQGYSYKVSGEIEELTKEFSNLGVALGMAVLLIYMILASQFESLLNPFIIMLSVPLAFGGGALGLVIRRTPLSIPAIIGAVVLSGVVVNGAIILIDYIGTRRELGEERTEAILNAGPIRLKPILMTTLTTILGLLPMVVAKGAKTLAPMAIVVIGGLTLATALILVFIPVLYTIFDDFSMKRRRQIKETE